MPEQDSNRKWQKFVATFGSFSKLHDTQCCDLWSYNILARLLFCAPSPGAPTCPSMPPTVTPLFAYHQAVTIDGSDDCTTASLSRCTRDVTTRLDNEWRRQRRRRNSLMTGAKALVVGATDCMYSYLVYRQAG